MYASKSNADMTQDIRLFLIHWFDQYVNRYRGEGGILPATLELKYAHSLRVAENARLIACGLVLEQQDVILAEGCGLLHDIGRFAQYDCYGSFSDADTVDHGLQGRLTLETEALPERFNTSDWAGIACAVEYHNRKTDDIPADLPADARRLLKIIRDADKLDIMDLVLQSVIRDGFLDLPGMLPHIRLSRELTPDVIEEIRKGKSISISKLRTLADFLLMLASWFYDLNYSLSVKLAVSRNILQRLERELPDHRLVRKMLEDIKTTLTKR
ncbi:MAG: HD domain-containing protein [Smithellaceae bacterium]